MNKKFIYLVLAFFAFAFTSNAQTISMIGDGVSGWSTDVDMTTADNVHYTLSNFTFSNGGAKFRQGHDWGNNWGASNFPSGTATSNGNNIPTTAGVYDVTFNLTTKAYVFTPVALGYADISVYGTANSNTDAAMSTIDGVHYNLSNYAVTLGDLVFRQDQANTNTWAAVDFPSGTATSGGTAISVIPGTYNISFNLTTGAYSFTFATISIIGDGLAGWGTDTDMTTTDGVNYSLNLTTFSTHQVKFRQDHAWAFSWGSSAFPSGTASLNGNNINTIAGDYVVTFNRNTGAYNFSNSYPVISLNSNGTDIDMVTLDGDNYYLNNFAFTAGSYKFRQGHANTFVWGASSFPNGTAATYIASAIPVAGKNYNVSFNKTTGVYSFSYVTISIIGDATPGGWGADTDMSTADGITYTLSGTTLTNAAVKFRLGHDWSTNWGSNVFPSGIAYQGGNNIAVNEGSVYNISFNIQTGEFNFNDTLKSRVRDSQCGSLLTSLSDAILAVRIPSAQMYRYEVTNGATVNTFETTKYSFDLTQLPGSTYNSTYNVRVAVKINDVWRSYGATCDIYTPAITTSANVPTTQIIASQWGSTLAGLDSPIHAKWMYSAEAYRFEVTNGAVVTTYDSPIYYFNLTKIVGSTYATTYSIRVAVKVSGTWGDYGASCNISTPSLASVGGVPTTQILATECGTTLAAMNTPIHAKWMYNTQGYRFEVTPEGSSPVVYETTSYYFNLNKIAGSAYGTNYSIRVAINVEGTWGSYGSSCTVTSPTLSSSTVPTTKVHPAFCGTTLAALDTKIPVTPIAAAEGYRFEITTGGVVTVYDSSTYNFKLSQAGVVVANATVYSIRVAAKVNGIYGAYGVSCDVTTPASIAKHVVETADFGVTAYPNPFNGAFKLQVSGTNNESVSVVVYDMMGKQIENRVINASDIENVTLGQDYSTGIYNVLVSQGMNTKTVRLVKN